jgi:hypothetical protein
MLRSAKRCAADPGWLQYVPQQRSRICACVTSCRRASRGTRLKPVFKRALSVRMVVGPRISDARSGNSRRCRSALLKIREHTTTGVAPKSALQAISIISSEYGMLSPRRILSERQRSEAQQCSCQNNCESGFHVTSPLTPILNTIKTS